MQTIMRATHRRRAHTRQEGTGLGHAVVETVHEGGHVLTEDKRHAAKAPCAVIVAVALSDARTAKPLHLLDMWRIGVHIREVSLRRHATCLAGLVSETLDERGRILTDNRIHATERGRAIGFTTPPALPALSARRWMNAAAS